MNRDRAGTSNAPHETAFELEILPVSVAFGAGQRRSLPAHLDRLAIARPLLVGTRQASTRYLSVFESIRDRPCTTFFGAEAHCPEPIVERCRQTYIDADCDGVIAIGGGSTLGLGKILAAEQAAKFIALPTTYSGSEMTPLFGRKIGNEKRVKRDASCRPDFVIYDADLTKDLPVHIATTSGMNSIAHAVEALYPKEPNPLAPLLAEQALVSHRSGLREIASGSPTLAALAAAQYGGFLGGLLVSMCGIALHHQLCHVIGGLFDLPHGETNSVILPHAVAYNSPAIPDAREVLERVFESDNAANALFDFAQALSVPQSLRELGMPASGVDATVEGMLNHGGWNPRPLEKSSLTALVIDAFEGRRPRTF